MKTILVTGGAGFIGSHFVRHVLAVMPRVRVVTFDKLTYAGNIANLKSVLKHPRHKFVRGDVCNLAQLRRCVRGVHAVVHFAAETHVDRSILEANGFFITNVLGTKNVLDACLATRVKRLVHISTDEVYGSIVNGKFREENGLFPNSPYAASKASADHLVRSYWKTYKLPAVILRISNNFGPNQFPEKVIPLFVTNLIEGRRLPLYGKGHNRREWLYVKDSVRGILLAFQKGRPGEVYNLGSRTEMTNIDLARKLLAAFGKGADRIHHVRDRLGHDFRYRLDCSKIERLGFRTRYSFDAALRETISWYRAHPDWWRPLKRDRFTRKS